MGCCFSSSAPVVNHHSPEATKPQSPVNREIEENPLRNKRAAVDLDPQQQRRELSEVDQLPANEEEKPNLKVFTLSELKSATRNFRPDTVLGEGGFGTVFKGWIDEKTLAPSRVGVGIPIAVKKSNPDSEQGIREWQAEVEFLGKLRHQNLVKLLGYCCEDKKQFLLVYEYMQKGSLESHLFRKGADPLPWETRLSIAIEAAQGLAFLHNTRKQVIYRDFKASNILLDSNFGVKLSDFGLAKQGPLNGNSHVTTRVIGTQGYAAPEYVATGHLYIKSDVYAFGVVLLELLTGRRVVDLNRPAAQTNLVEWAKPIIQDKRKLTRIVDQRLEGQYPKKAAIQIAELIYNCLESDPRSRPSMDEVLQVLQQIIATKMKPKEFKAAMKNQTKNDLEFDPQIRSPLRYQHVGPSNRAADYRSPLPMSKPAY